MSAIGDPCVEELVALAHDLCRAQPDLERLLLDVERVRGEVERMVEAHGDAAAAAQQMAQLSSVLHGCGLGPVASGARSVEEIRARLKRLHALIASVAVTRSADRGGAS